MLSHLQNFVNLARTKYVELFEFFTKGHTRKKTPPNIVLIGGVFDAKPF